MPRAGPPDTVGLRVVLSNYGAIGVLGAQRCGKTCQKSFDS